jgi:hypothetical protein
MPRNLRIEAVLWAARTWRCGCGIRPRAGPSARPSTPRPGDLGGVQPGRHAGQRRLRRHRAAVARLALRACLCGALRRRGTTDTARVEPLRLRRTAAEGLRLNTQAPGGHRRSGQDVQPVLVSVPDHRQGRWRSQQRPDRRHAVTRPGGQARRAGRRAWAWSRPSPSRGRSWPRTGGAGRPLSSARRSQRTPAAGS